MKQFALIGKSISHSKSPLMYKNLLNIPHEYHLLDIESEFQIPSLASLAKKYVGINITSPYKKFYMNQAELSKNVIKCNSLNCLKYINETWYAENTDYLAIVELLKVKYVTFLQHQVVILGDGVMSKVVIAALDEMKTPYKVFSRRLTDNFDQLNLEHLTENVEDSILIINTCSRDFIFKGKLPLNFLFWDFNYAFAPHLSHKKFSKSNYTDGEELLFLQAKYACLFWSDIINS